MKRLLLASVSALAIGSAASAADIPVARKAPAALVMAPATWTGFYLGLQGGGLHHDGDFEDILGGFFNNGKYSTHGWGGLVGGFVGVNWQQNNIIYGLESDFNWTSAKGENSYPVCSVCSGLVHTADISWLGSVRGRLGLLFDTNTMVYATAGWAFGEVKNSAVVSTAAGVVGNSISETRTASGWTAGVGFEHMVRNWTWRIEGRYTDLGSSGDILCVPGAFSCNAPNTYRGSFSNTLLQATVGLALKF